MRMISVEEANKGTTEVQFRNDCHITDAKGKFIAGKRGVITARFGSPKKPHSKAAAVVFTVKVKGVANPVEGVTGADMDLV